MNHQQFKELLPLAASGDLSSADRSLLEEHLRGCSECRTELEEIAKAQSLVLRTPRIGVTDTLLEEARQELRVALRLERSRVSLWERLMRRVDEAFAPWVKVVLGSAAMLAVGFLAGSIVFRNSGSSNGGMIVQKVSDATEVTRGEAQITNVRFEDSDPSDGEIAFSFDALSPVRIKGNPNDAGIQGILSKALMNEENPGVRLKTVSAITSQIQIRSEKPTTADNQVKLALVDAMKYDENPAVRQEALRALKKFPFDDEIKLGLLHVLTKDKSQGMRVEAINSLGAARSEIKSSDDQLLDILRKKIASDNNRYVREQSRRVLEEVKEQ